MTRWLRPVLLGLGFLATGAVLRAHESMAPAAYSISILVDGSRVPEYASRGRLYIEASKGKDFTIRLSNPTAERVAVALSVDGRNVIDARRTTETQATKWVLGPGQTVEIPGWQVSGETARKFFFTETSRSYAKWLGDTANVGIIEAVFFREKRPGRFLPLQAEPPSDERVPRPLSAPAPEAPSAKSRAADENAATGIGDKTRFPVEWVAFDGDPAPAARIAVRYEFHAELLRLGVLPREADDPYAREHASGFEPHYAPDPYGHR